jgi:transglutaminase-like putative cysteine protease
MKTSLFGLFCLILIPVASLSAQSSNVMIRPPSSWVEPQSFDAAAVPPEGQGAGYYYLLVDEQDHAQLEEGYRHFAYKILTSEGLQEMSDISVSFDPAYEKVTVHTLRIHRNGQVIDQMPKTFRTIQREQSMDRFIYDGTLTVVINLNDVRVGDVIEYACSRKGDNPVNRGRGVWYASLNYGFGTDANFQRVVVPEKMPVYLSYTNTDQKPVITTKAGQTVYTWSGTRIPASVTEEQTPPWHRTRSHVMITSFANWGEVADWAVPLFTVTEVDRKKLAAMAAKQFKATTPEAYVEEVVRFVQDEVRYLGFETGMNSHMPHSPLAVYNQRFGDCKDKALLLTTLLNARGIEAYPMLVNTSKRGHVSEEGPSMYAFDHCVAQITLHDSTFYIDATINGQGGTAGRHHFPAYGKGLVIDGRSRDFVALDKSPSSTSETQTFYLSAVGEPALLTVRTVYTGGNADYMRSDFNGSSLEEIQKSYLEFYGQTYPEIEAQEPLQFTDLRDSNIFVIEEHYRIPAFWKPKEDDLQTLTCEVSAQSLNARLPSPSLAKRTAPYELTYPLNFTHTIIVHVPEDWAAKEYETRIDRDYYAYHHTARYADRTIELTTHYETLAASVPANQYQQFIDDHEKMRGEVGYDLTYKDGKNAFGSPESQVPSGPPTPAGYALLAVAFLLAIVAAVYVYNQYDPVPAYPSEWARPLEGGLVYARYALIATFVVLIAQVVVQPDVASDRWLSALGEKRYGMAALFALQQVYGVMLIPFGWLSIRLFQRGRSSTPRVTTVYYGAIIGMPLLSNIVAAAQSPESWNGSVSSMGLIAVIVVSGLWIYYFRTSPRIERTFVYSLRGQG